MHNAKIGILAFCFLGPGVSAQAARNVLTPTPTKTAPVQSAKKLDAGTLGTSSLPTPSPTPAAGVSAKQDRTKSISNDDGTLDAKAEKDLFATLTSLTVVINRTPPGPGRDRLVLNRAVANNRYGRQKLLSEKKYSLTEEVKRYLNASIADADSLIANPKTAPDILIMAHDIAGTSAVYLEKSDLSRAHFLQELKLNPPADKAGRIGLTIAEQDFNSGNYAEAAKFYTYYYSKMTNRWKELSLYKLGWCAINLKQPDQAKSYFLKIAKASSPTGIGRDAVRDLAYLTSSKAGSVPEVLATQQKIPAVSDQIVYLSDVLANLEALNFPQEHAQIVDRLLQVEKNPVERVGILLSQIRIQKKAYASLPHLKAFTVTADYIQKMDGKTLKAVLAKHESSLELESENIFRAFIDTYAGRVRTLEGQTQTPAQLIEALRAQLVFFRKIFPQAPHFPIIVELWENLCLDNKDWAGVDDITQFIISDQPHLAGLLENAYLNQIAALDQLNTDPSRRANRLKEFVEKFPNSPRWPQVAKSYAQNELNAGHFDVAQKVWAQLMVSQPSDENFYQLQFCRFKQGDLKGVLSDSRNQAYLKPQSNLMDLYREASLKAAEVAKQAGDQKEYREHIEEFIKLSTDPEKARIARLDYFNFLLTNGNFEDAQARYAALSADEKKSQAYEGFRQDLWKKTIEKENYALAVKVAPSLQQAVMSRLLAGTAVNFADLDALPKNERAYFAGIYALFDPDFAIRYFRSHTPLAPADRDLLILSYRLKFNQWQLARSPELEKVLGKSFSFAETTSPPLSIEKSIDAVEFPDLSKLSATRQARVVEDHLYLVRKYRKPALKAISGKTAETQLRVLEKLIQLESKMADYLTNSPIPAGLTPEQVAQYQAGLKGAAEEFTQQAQQFKLLADKSKEGMDKGKHWLENRTLPEPDLGKWPWPNGVNKNEKLAAVFKLVKAGNLMGGMALLDYLRMGELPSDEDFFLVRAGAILQTKTSDSMRIYLLEELERNKQSKIISQWAELVHHPVPEAL